MSIIKVKTGGITADAITDALIADDVVGTEHLTANEVDTTALGADAVTGAQLADDAVNSEHYTDGSIDTAHLADGQVTTAKLATAVFTGATDIGADLADADLILVDDGAGGTIRKAALSRLKTYASSANTPAFAAHMAADQSSLSDNTWTKLTMETEFFDSDSKYNTSNQRFTPTVAGKYMFGATIHTGSTGTAENGGLAFYKNGSKLLYMEENLDNIQQRHLTGVITLDDDDYVELYAYINAASSGNWEVNMDGTTANNRTFWYGYKLAGA
jgi:hypothetical protein